MDQKERKKLSVQYFQKAFDAQKHGNLEEAMDFYQKSIDAYPTPEALTFLGWTFSFLHNYDEAIRLCKRAIQLDPEFGNPYNDIGSYLIEQGKLDDAIPYFERALKASRYDSYCYPYYNLGRVWEKKGMIHRARQSYQQALEENPEYGVAADALEKLKYALN